MPADTWQPPQTGDLQLDRSFLDLADRLAGIDALLASVAIPGVRITSKNVVLVDESYCEIRGSVAVIVTLPPAAFRGKGRGALLTIQNFSTQTATVIVQRGDVLNDGSTFTVDPNSGALFSGNGVARWTGIKPGGGHLIRNGVVAMANRRALNFSDDFILSDDPSNDETDIDINFPDATAYPGLEGIWLAGAWYPAGLWQEDAANSLAISAAGANTNFRYAVPQYFGRAGTINKLGCRHSSINDDHWQAVYAANTAGDGPGARLVSAQ